MNDQSARSVSTLSLESESGDDVTYRIERPINELIDRFGYIYYDDNLLLLHKCLPDQCKAVAIPKVIAYPMIYFRRKIEKCNETGKTPCFMQPNKCIQKHFLEFSTLNFEYLTELIQFCRACRPIKLLNYLIYLLTLFDERLFKLSDISLEAVLVAHGFSVSQLKAKDVQSKVFAFVKKYHNEATAVQEHANKMRRELYNTKIAPLLKAKFNAPILHRDYVSDIFDDLHSNFRIDLDNTKEHNARNIIRFYVVNLIHLIRRYANLLCAKLPKNLDVQAHRQDLSSETEYKGALHIAEHLGPLLIELDHTRALWKWKLTELNNYRKMSALMVLLTTSTSTWEPGKTLKDVIFFSNPVICHPGCKCGLDLAL